HPVVTGCGGVSFIEDEIDYLQHRRQAGSTIWAVGHLEGHVGFSKCALGAHDALGDGWLRRQKSARDLLRSQTAQQAKREGDARFRRENRVARDEDEAEQVIAHIVVVRDVKVRHEGVLLSLELAAEFLVLAFEELVSAKMINGAMLSRGHEPGTGFVRDSRLRPFFERDDQSVLSKLFGHTDVADNARQ